MNTRTKKIIAVLSVISMLFTMNNTVLAEEYSEDIPNKNESCILDEQSTDEMTDSEEDGWTISPKVSLADGAYTLGAGVYTIDSQIGSCKDINISGNNIGNGSGDTNITISVVLGGNAKHGDSVTVRLDFDNVIYDNDIRDNNGIKIIKGKGVKFEYGKKNGLRAIKFTALEDGNGKTPEMMENKLTGKRVRSCGSGDITYYSQIPFYGKSVNKNNLSKILGDITISNDNVVFKVTKAKIVRKKLGGNKFYESSNNGNDDNASIVIQKIEVQSGQIDKANEKEFRWYVNNISKPSKQNKLGPYSIAIYPYTLDNETIKDLEEPKLSGKPGKYKFSFKINGQKITLKQGKKDSTKQEIKVFSYDGENLKIDCEDISGTVSACNIDTSKVK